VEDIEVSFILHIYISNARNDLGQNSTQQQSAVMVEPLRRGLLTTC